jgi:predicted neuraminidase
MDVVGEGLIFPADDAPTPQCHASTIAEMDGGAFLAAWFGGAAEGEDDVGIWLARCEGGIWNTPREVANGLDSSSGPDWPVRHPCWNPVLFRPSGGPVLLFYKCGPDPRRWSGMLTTSADGGRTWDWPRRLPELIYGPTKNKPLELPDGSLLCPAGGEQTGWSVHFERTADLGRSWTRTEPLDAPEGVGAIQPTILVHPGGRLQALCRTGSGFIGTTWSDDMGRTWSAIEPTDLPNPNSGIDAVTLADGRHLLVYNPIARGRNNLSVAASEDGVDWSDALDLEDDEDANAEYSYPAVIQAADGAVHVTYTHRRRSIKHVVLNAAGT